MSRFSGEQKFIISIILVSVLILVGGITLASKAPGAITLTKTEGVQLVLPELSHDWGDVSKSKGLVSYRFKLQNTGSNELIVANLKTSCMCTQAQLKTKRGESPFFGMHEVSSWKGTILPAETAEIIATYDPNAHGPTDLGRRERIITFDTNDPKRPTVELKVAANVIQ